jgi:hypothetical protein
MPIDKPPANPATLTPVSRPLVETASDLLSVRGLLWLALALALVLGFAVLATHQRPPIALPAANAGR